MGVTRWLDDELEAAFRALEAEVHARERREVCLQKGHDAMEVTRMDSFCREWICRRCGDTLHCTYAQH